MGVTGLLPLLKQIQEPTSLMRYKGKTLAIDTYAWLHRSILTCTMELAQDLPTNKYINYVLKRLDMLEYFGVIPYFVFDGDYLPCKNNTEVNRELKRSEYKKQGISALEKGDSKTAFSCFQKSCDITPSMAKLLIDVLKKRNIKYVVAPYEADSQMVYLEKMGIVDGIISEDSDLLIFGCNRLITKLNEKGECVEINKENFNKCKQVPVNYLSPEQLIMVAALSGCDYTKGIPGIGIIKSFGLVKRYGTIEKIIAALKLEGKFKVPDTFLEEYRRAKYAFQFQLVFDPISKSPTNLSSFPEEPTPMMRTCSGERLDDTIHLKIATGDLHPIEKTPLFSREESLLKNTCKESVAIRTSSLYQGRQLNSFGYTPVKVATRAYSTPVSTRAPKLNTIDHFFPAKSKVKIKDDSYKTPNSTKRPQKILSSELLESGLPKEEIEATKLSPIAKRKKLLNSNEQGSSTLLISKFFQKTCNKKTEVVKENENVEEVVVINSDSIGAETHDLSDVDEHSHQSSFDIGDLQEDELNISEITQDGIEKESGKDLNLENILHQEMNSSDFEVDELSDHEQGDEQMTLTQTHDTVKSQSKESLLVSITEKIGSKPRSEVVVDKNSSTVMKSESSNDEISLNVERKLIIDDIRMGLRNKFRFDLNTKTRRLQAPSSKRIPLQAIVPEEHNRMRDNITEKYQYQSRKAIKNTESFKGITSSFLDKTKKLNLDSFKYTE